MKFTAAATALLFAVPSVNAFAPTTVAFRSSSPLFATEAATEEKVGRIRYILSTNDSMYIVETIAVLWGYFVNTYIYWVLRTSPSRCSFIW